MACPAPFSQLGLLISTVALWVDLTVVQYTLHDFKVLFKVIYATVLRYRCVLYPLLPSLARACGYSVGSSTVAMVIWMEASSQPFNFPMIKLYFVWGDFLLLFLGSTITLYPVPKTQ